MQMPVVLILAGALPLCASTAAVAGEAAEAPPAVVHAMIVYGTGDGHAPSGREAAPWIADEARALGAARAFEQTPWIALAADDREIYNSRMGGRLVKAKAVPGPGGVLRVTVSGYKIGKNRYDVELASAPGTRRLVQLTDYPGGNNFFMALHVGEAEEPGERPSAPASKAIHLDTPETTSPGSNGGR